MGRESAGGVLKLDLRDSMEGCADNENDRRDNETAVRRITCGNLEDKVGMLWITPAC
jgi:hypothetical protein